MRPAHIFIALFFIVLLSACSNHSGNEFAFYHWKKSAKLDGASKEALELAGCKKLYLHYFDVDVVKEPEYGDEGVYPISVLRRVDEATRDLDIVPVVFITNRVFKTKQNPIELAGRIKDLIGEMNQSNFGRAITEIQLDCDWTVSTREPYFALLEELKKYFEVSVTIRLHQIKYHDKTGVPPVEKGVLMVYNVGELKDMSQNSILQSNIVADYINSETDYPLELNIALPLFSQMVVKNNDGEIRLLKNDTRETLDAATDYFKLTDENLYEVLNDTLYRGLYLYKGYQIKMEMADENEVVKAYQIIKNSRLKTGEVIFYHLDNEVLAKTDIKNLIQQL